MRQLTEHEIVRAQALKAARAAIRLKHSLNADAEIARRLPEFEDRINAAINSGEPAAITTQEFWGDDAV